MLHVVGDIFSQSTLPTPQTIQLPKAVPSFMPRNPAYPQFSGIPTSSQAIPRQNDGSSVATDHVVRHPVRNSFKILLQLPKIYHKVWASQEAILFTGGGMFSMWLHVKPLI
jgi:hypothetical protein